MRGVDNAYDKVAQADTINWSIREGEQVGETNLKNNQGANLGVEVGDLTDNYINIANAFVFRNLLCVC